MEKHIEKLHAIIWMRGIVKSSLVCSNKEGLNKEMINFNKFLIRHSLLCRLYNTVAEKIKVQTS